MSEVQDRLRDCFRAAFPAAPRDSLETLTSESYEPWDSLARLTLVMLVEERFGLRIPTEDIPTPLSFETLARYLERPDPRVA